ncbi:MAG TPA: DUF2505 domain-containing protein [Microlunatus sp.]|nr:DUF2505 domain-containing protein [Microlunatus sp.]
MDISSSAQFAADPDRVYAMMTDRAYLEEVCRATEASTYEVSVVGPKTRSTRSLKAPASAAKFTGPELTVVEEVTWGAGEGGGTRTGKVTMTIPGQPVTMNGTMRIAPAGPGTVLSLDGVLKVAIPLLGKKLEESAAPAVMAGFRTHQKVGDRWLAV